jgi:hypothetical protein
MLGWMAKSDDQNTIISPKAMAKEIANSINIQKIKH